MAPPTPSSSWAVPIGVMTAATIAGLFSVISLIISKENRVTEFRQAWIDAQRDDLAEIIALAAALEVAPLEKRAENLAAFDRSFARILLRDNPKESVAPEARWASSFKWRMPTRSRKRPWSRQKPTVPPFPWAEVTVEVETLRLELGKGRIDTVAVRHSKAEIVRRSRLLLKAEWDIVKGGEFWFAMARQTLGSFVVTLTAILGAILASAAYFQLVHPWIGKAFLILRVVCRTG